MSRERYLDAVKYIEAIPQFIKGTGIERAERMLALMGNPENKLKIIHVAGTNGKGSVCSYLERILRENGYKTGLFTSPHLEDIRERIQINGSIITEELFVKGFEAVKATSLTDKGAEELICQNNVQKLITKSRVENILENSEEYAYFDWLLGIAMYAFVQEQVDYVIMETGLGGRFDATNAVKKPIISVITTISLEHTAILGDTVEKIAAEKAGIIKPGVPVVYLNKIKEAAEVIEETAVNCGSMSVAVAVDKLQIHKNDGKYIDFSMHNEYYKNDYFTVATAAAYQVQNCSLALTAAAVLNKNGSAVLDEEVTAEAVKKAGWSGRMELVADNVYVDGAHNPEGIKALIDTVSMIKNDRQCILLFSVVNDKNYEQMIGDLCASGLFDRFVITQIEGSRKLSGQSINQIFKAYTDKQADVFEQLDEAFAYATELVENVDALLICSGSLYLVGDIKKLIHR